LVALLINISTEIAKSRAADVRTVMLLDVSGCAVALLILVGVSVCGVFDALWRHQEPLEAQLARVHHLDSMVLYAGLAIFASLANLGCFFYLYDSMLAGEDGATDQQNLRSTLAHAVVDFVTNFVVLGTSIWLRSTARREDPSGRRESEMAIKADAIGAFVVCVCIFLSVLLIGRDLIYECKQL